MNAHSQGFFDLDAAPISVAHVTLLVQDLDRMARFYTQLLGLTAFRTSATEVELGVDRPFLTLKAPGGLEPSPRHRPGLFHTAFLLPSREDLGAWFQHARRTGTHLLGSDHTVSEALYLTDPEGQGIEVYADRPLAHWHDGQGRLQMGTAPIDFGTLPQGRWTGAPKGTRIGHVHLRTTDLVSASTFWTAHGFDLMAQYPGALFWGAGGYHHQLATNVWAGKGQAPRHDGLTGLSEITLLADIAQPKILSAPSGVQINFKPKED